MALASLDMCPAEDAVQALLDYLVDPVLPPRASVDVVPSLAQQQTVAKQVHAVVVLYNYYQKKRHPDIEYLGFESFSKLAVIVKPALIGHMKLLLLSDYAMLDNLEDQLSVMEKTIMDACDISSVLDPSKDAPNIEGWPVMKVAVLLTDSSRENCLLQFSSTTHGVWSVIEKGLDILKNKRKRKSRKLSPEEASAEEAACLQLAFSSVMEVTGIDEHHLSVLESHIVYSLTKEKTATRFYIMQCAQSISKDLEVPIRSVIERLQGPLFKKSYNGWTVTPVVEYFHLLPYSGILLDCLSRKVFSDAMLRVELLKEDDGPSIMKIDGIHDKEGTDGVHDSDVNPSKKVDESRDNPDKNSVKEVSDNGHCSKKPDIIPADESPIMRIEGIHDKEDTEVNPTKKVVESRDNAEKNPVKEVSENEDNSKNSDTMPRVELQQEDDSPFMRIDEIHAKKDSEGINDSDVNPSKTVTEYRDNPGKKSDKEVSQNGDNPRESSTISDSAASEANQSNAEALGKRGDSAKATRCLSNSSNGPRDMDIDNSSPVCRPNENVDEINRNDIICYQRRRRGAPGRRSSFKAHVDNSISKPHIMDLNDRDGDAGSMTSSIISSDQNGLSMGDLSVVLPLDQTSNTMAYNKNALSETALKLLLNKRRNLVTRFKEGIFVNIYLIVMCYAAHSN